MLTAIVTSIIRLLNPLKPIMEEISKYYEIKIRAQNEKERIEADLRLKELEAQKELVLASLQYRTTRWIRPAFALIAFIFWFKIVVWDTVLGLGVTPDPGEYVWWFVTMIPAAVFLTRPLEKWALRK